MVPYGTDRPPPDWAVYDAARDGPAVAGTNGHVVDDEESKQAGAQCDALYSDVAALLDGTLPEPPKPALLTRTDGHALFYAGRVNALFGDPEVGKTWVALAACVEGLRAGRRVLIMDLDHNGLETIVANLLLLGAPVAALRDPNVFRHCEPDGPGDIYRIVADCEIWRPAVAIVDSLGELLPMLGMSSNDADEYTVANARVLQPLADGGAAVIGIDHLAKNLASRAAGPTGAVAKRRALGGASIRVKAGRQFIPGKGGTALLVVNKDRHGGLRRNCPTGDREPLAGVFVMDAADDNGAVGWRVVPPAESVVSTLDDRTAHYLAAIRGLDDTFTLRDVAVAVSGEAAPTKSQLDTSRYEIDKLVDSGVVERASKSGVRGSAVRWRFALESSSESALFSDPDSELDSELSAEFGKVRRSSETPGEGSSEPVPNFTNCTTSGGVRKKTHTPLKGCVSEPVRSADPEGSE